MRAALGSSLLRHEQDADESRRLAQAEGFRIILAGSGMCEAGRIRHHLKQGLWDSATVVAMVGFQAMGTLGRLLLDGAPRVRIQGETFQVAAHVAKVEGYSGHADGPELGRWIAARAPIAGAAFLVHGEPEAIEGLALRVAGRGILPDARIIRPLLDETFLLEPGQPPRRDATAAPRRRGQAAEVGRPDWHNQRAALLLSIEEAIERSPDETSRAALLDRLRHAMEDR
jgi:metallo-beta-lactamase family protein